MKVIINGGRAFNLKAAAFEYLDMLHAKEPITFVIEGGAIGADTIAREWAISRKIRYITYHAQWKKYGRAAGHRRNQEMVDLNPDLVITFPGGKGTEDLVNRAKIKKLKIIRVEEHFTLTELPEE